MDEPLALKRPATPDDLAAVVRFAAESGAQVKITGSDSLPLAQFDAGRAVQPVSTLRMNKILEHAVGDMTVSVQAGMTLEGLQRQLAWRDQWLPVDPPAGSGRSPGGRTLGGMIATNSLGPLRMGLAGGDWRRLILGMRWVDAHGELIKGGGQTVKNVAGYSSPRMMIGSAGTLGVIAEVTLRTFARPADERCVIFFCESAARVEELLAEVLVAPCVADYLQVVGGRTWAGNPLGLPVPGDVGGMTVIVGFLGRAETCGAQVEIVRELAAARGVESIAQSAAQCGRLRLWMTSEPSVAGAGEMGVGLRVHGGSSRVAEIISRVEVTERVEGVKAWVVSEAGSGVVRMVLEGAGSRGLAGELAREFERNVVFTAGEGMMGDADVLVERLKGALDPQSIFGHMR